MTVAMVGTPVALAVGVSAGTFLAEIVGWRYTFGVMSILSVVLIAWVMRSVPAFPGQERGASVPILRTLCLPGVVPVLFVTLIFVLAHNISTPTSLPSSPTSACVKTSTQYCWCSASLR